MLAYSSVAHGGYLLVAITAANQASAGAALFYLLVYTVMNISAFAVVIAVSNHGEERLELEDYAGLGRTQPGLALLLTLFLLSLAGFPGTGGFMAKFQLLLGAADAQLWTLSVILVLSTVVSYAYYLRLAWYAWMREPAAESSSSPVYIPIGMRLALMLGAAVVIWLGLFPGPVLDLARASAVGLGGTGGTVGILP
jgi:NADH-quinone oxidoreductase subunit N